ncbi:MAG: RsiV family protein [Prevotella sp.]|nr:RsiV family protein [Prevotella sp.]
MRKHLISLIGLLAILSCGQKSNSSSDSDEQAGTKQAQELEVTPLEYSYDKNKVEVGLDIDYPTGSALIDKAVAEYISEKLGGTYDGDLANGDSLVSYYGDEILAELKKHLKEDINNGVEDEYINGYYRKMEIKKEYETDLLVTYSYTEDIYLNGAHGMQYFYGQTFRKSDGRRFDEGMMRQLYSEEMYELRKEGLREYFNESGDNANTDEELKECIITDDDVNYLPMPKHTPYVTKKGMVFIYQPYEISYYAAGAPTFTIPLKKMKPFLTQTAKELLEM